MGKVVASGPGASRIFRFAEIGAGEEAQESRSAEPIANMAICPIFAWSIIDESQTGNTGGSQIHNPVASGDKVDVCEVWNL